MTSGHTVFEFNDHIKYLENRFSSHGPSRGMRLKLAHALNAKPTNISKMLSGKIKINLEAVPIINKLLEHTDEESEFFMLLVLWNQAGSKALEDFFKGQIESILENRRVRATWVKNKKELNDEQLAVFVSSWLYPVIYVLLAVPEFQNKTEIAKKLKLGLSTVTDAIDTLIKLGIVRQSGSKYIQTDRRVHIKKNSAWIAHYHSLIRQLGIRSFTESAPEDLHYSFVMSVKKSEKEKIRKKLQEFIAEIEPMIEAPGDDEVSALSVDLFSI